ncbi:hypothetical protein BU26DRAFT_407348, partial [Trematosphaeria pertusa]
EATNFEPIPELKSPEADLTIIGLLNKMGYRNPIRDPWFNAQNCTTNNTFTVSPEICTATNAITFLGCTERYQFCASDGTNCSPFTGLYGINPVPEQSPDLNPTQKALFQLIWKIAWFAQLNFQLAFVGRENLIANEYLWDDSFSFRISASLPDDHWQRETANWMNTSLALMQRAAFGFARPPAFDVGPDISVLKHVVEPDDPAMQALCHKVKFRSKAHTSFRVAGLFGLLAAGLAIIVLSVALPKVVAYIQKRSGRGLHKKLEWIESSAFQLQRMAAEGRGVGPWDGREDDVPTLAEYGHLF